jgi:phosphoribosylformimino-5-aminoimidazole carboxamide ribotide isomerase
MRILPVIDILGGTVVRGVAGERATYRPVESTLTTTTDPVGVAVAIRDAFGFDKFYLADLDGIVHSRPNRDVVRQLRAAGILAFVDAGAREVGDYLKLLDSGAAAVIVGLETSPSRAMLADLLASCDQQQAIFSVDLRGGEPMGQIDGRGDDHPLEIADAAIALGFGRLIVLDLHAVGVGSGPATLPLCRTLRDRYPDIELITGGGVRNVADLRLLADSGVDAALVASALHQGQITPEELRDLGGRSSC